MLSLFSIKYCNHIIVCVFERLLQHTHTHIECVGLCLRASIIYHISYAFALLNYIKKLYNNIYIFLISTNQYIYKIFNVVLIFESLFYYFYSLYGFLSLYIVIILFLKFEINMNERQHFRYLSFFLYKTNKCYLPLIFFFFF